MKTDSPITHYELEAGNVDLYSVHICSECGKDKLYKINTVFGRRYEQQAIARGYTKLIPRPGDELCDCD